MHVISEMCFVVRSSSVMVFIVSLFFMFHTSTARHAAWHVETTNLVILDCEVRWKKVLHNISVQFDTAFKIKGTKKNERCLTRFAQQMFPRIKLWVLVSKFSFSLNKSQLIITKVSLTSQSPNSMPKKHLISHKLKLKLPCILQAGLNFLILFSLWFFPIKIYNVFPLIL